MKKNNISRKDFLIGAAAGAVGVATMGMLSGCSSNPSTEDTTECPTANHWLGQEPTIAASDIKHTWETEILVVGAGTAGLFAAAAAGEEGAKTILIEKGLTGNGIRSDLGAANSRYQKAIGEEINQFDFITEMTKTAAGRVDQRLYKVWYEESGEAIDWYGDRLVEAGGELVLEAGGDDADHRYHHFATGHSPVYPKLEDGKNRSGASILTEYSENLGVDFHYSTPMVKLLKEDGKVTGAIAQNEAGEYIQINASKGVIVCTGGYAVNYDMLEQLQPENLAIIGRNGSYPGVTGDGIKAAIWAGAKFDDTHSMMMFDRAALRLDAKPGLDQLKNGDSGFFWMGSQPFLKVNKDGQRFFNESGTYEGILHADEFQKDKCHFTIFDADWATYAEAFRMHGCSRLFDFTNGAAPNRTAEAVANELPTLIEDGFVFQADSIEELAEKMELPVADLVATVDRYNEIYDMKEDVDFGKEASRLSAVRTAPFYGAKNTGYALCTMDGIQINTDMVAMDLDGQAIEGLYICGNDSGAFFSATYPNLATGIACGRSVTFARRAAKLACAK
ncbi:MAG: FAD-dependent oxidoreductase [Erysipelotrichaceae bacterium]